MFLACLIGSNLVISTSQLEIHKLTIMKVNLDYTFSENYSNFSSFT